MREERQEECIQALMEGGIANCAPRFGKVKVGLEWIKRNNFNKVLLIYPRTDILEGWKKDAEKFGYPINFTGMSFTMFAKEQNKGQWDALIIDEIHEMSVNKQKEVVKWKNIPIIGLSGTITRKTEDELYNNAQLDIKYKYSIEQGVNEGILCDYKIYIHKVPLDNLKKIWGKRKVTEKLYFNQIYNQYQKTNEPFLYLKLLSVLQKSNAKLQYTKKLIEKYKNERLLVFCGVTEIADQLGIAVYHSKKAEKLIFDNFCLDGGVNHLATIKMMQAGVTIKPINKGIINYTSGNPEDCAQKICRFLGWEYDNENKKAELHIISADESFELSKIQTALNFFNKEKVEIL
jgi:superfamily II DNA or RNA helicase